MPKTPTEHWLDRVCAYLPAGHRRSAVRRELRAHLDDRLRALRAQGITGNDAEQQAVRAMGDADELGRALADLHHPLHRFFGLLCAALLWGVILLLFIYVLMHISACL